MTQQDIIEMAIKAELNLYVHDLTEKQYIQVIEAFAKLVAAKEREACAKVCEAQEDDGGEWDIQQQCANAIRARGET